MNETLKEILLKDLLEAGCYFGHKSEKWHPKAASFIYGEREGIHIIDLVKTKAMLEKAREFAFELGKKGEQILFVATKRQARGVVYQTCEKAEIPFLTSRWIGGFLTNWLEVKKNINKMLTFRKDKEDGVWNKFTKGEISKLQKSLKKLESVYAGVARLDSLPKALFIVDIKKEDACIREAKMTGIKSIAIVDTNSDPSKVDYLIPANDDAVGSIQFVVNAVVEAYEEGRRFSEKSDKAAKKAGVSKAEDAEKTQLPKEKAKTDQKSGKKKTVKKTDTGAKKTEVKKEVKPKKEKKR